MHGGVGHTSSQPFPWSGQASSPLPLPQLLCFSGYLWRIPILMDSVELFASGPAAGEHSPGKAAQSMPGEGRMREGVMRCFVKKSACQGHTAHK